MQVLHQLLYVMIGCAGRPVVQNMGCGMTVPSSSSLDGTPTHNKRNGYSLLVKHVTYICIFHNDLLSNFYYVYIYVKRLRAFVLIWVLY